MKINFWKKVLLVNSILFFIAGAYLVYAVTYGLLSLDWHRFMMGIYVFGFFCITEIVIAIIGDKHP